MAIQYKNQTFNLTATIATTVLTIDESSRAILQNIQTENTSTGTVDVASAVFDFSATATTQISTIQMTTLTTQNLAKGPVVLEEQIYRKTLSEDNSIVEIISLLNGKRTAFVQQIWDGSVCSTCPSYYNTDVVFAGDGALSFFNGKKLYHINY